MLPNITEKTVHKHSKWPQINCSVNPQVFTTWVPSDPSIAYAPSISTGNHITWNISEDIVRTQHGLSCDVGADHITACTSSIVFLLEHGQSAVSCLLSCYIYPFSSEHHIGSGLHHDCIPGVRAWKRQCWVPSVATNSNWLQCGTCQLDEYKQHAIEAGGHDLLVLGSVKRLFQTKHSTGCAHKVSSGTPEPAAIVLTDWVIHYSAGPSRKGEWRNVMCPFLSSSPGQCDRDNTTGSVWLLNDQQHSAILPQTSVE